MLGRLRRPVLSLLREVFLQYRAWKGLPSPLQNSSQSLVAHVATATCYWRIGWAIVRGSIVGISRFAESMFGFVPYKNSDFFMEGEVVPFDRGEQYQDCLDDIAHARRICETLGKDLLVVDRTNPEFGFPVVQVIIPGYSDVLPFHPANSKGLFSQWTRTDVLGSYH
jgi:hypothetical protein